MRPATPRIPGLVDRGDVRIGYDVYGDGDVALLFPPARAIADSTVWRAQIATLPQGYRVITFDPRGNGRSDRLTEPAAYAATEIVADLVAVLDAAETRRAVIVGYSFGCSPT